MIDLERRLHDEVGREVAGYAPTPELATRIRRRTRRRVLERRAVVVVVALMVVAVGVTVVNSLVNQTRETQRVTTVPPVTAKPASVEYEGDVTVLSDGYHGPQLCVSVATSLPPGCGGLPISNWKWSAATGQRTLNGVTWGEFHVVGTSDGTTFTLTRPVTEVNPEAPPTTAPTTDAYAPPCPTPAGGWPVAKTTLTEFQAFLNLASQSADFAGMWVDQQGRPVADPGRDVYTVAYTGDIAQHRAAIAATWRGPVCVIQVAHTQAELQQVSVDLMGTVAAKDLGMQMVSAGVDPVNNRVTALTFIATTADQAAVDHRYGSGVVHLDGALQPVH